ESVGMGLDGKYPGLILFTVESIAGVKEAILMAVVEEQVLGFYTSFSVSDFVLVPS
ncbi:hypothetical protein Tco_0958916, partial [Tanacetum coccineum]